MLTKPIQNKQNTKTWDEKANIMNKNKRNKNYFNYFLFTGHTVRPKSQCEHHRDSLQSGVELNGRHPVGAFIPQCDSDGRYRPLQVGTD